MFLINNLLYLERTKMFHCKKKNIQISTNLCLSIHIVVALAHRYDELGHTTLRTPTNSNREHKGLDTWNVEQKHIHSGKLCMAIPLLFTFAGSI